VSANCPSLEQQTAAECGVLLRTAACADSNGSAEAREIIRDYEWYFGSSVAAGGGGPTKTALRGLPGGTFRFSVLITTYEVAIQDETILKAIPWKALVVDEGHTTNSFACCSFPI
jgi:hypothetical protein